MPACVKLKNEHILPNRPDKLDQNLEYLLSKDFSNTSYKEIISEIHKKVGLIGTVDFPLPNNSKIQFYRITHWFSKHSEYEFNQLAREVSSFYYPPILENKKQQRGRCNLPNQQILYGASNFMSALKEMDSFIPIGGPFFISIWELDCSNLKFSNFSYSVSKDKGVDERPIFESVKPKLINEIGEEKYEYLDQATSIICNIFCREEDSLPNSNIYALSSALANYCFDKGSGVILYPTVKNEMNGVNLAIKKDAADSNTQLKNVLLCERKGNFQQNDAKFNIACIGNAQGEKGINYRVYKEVEDAGLCERLLRAKYTPPS